MARFPLVSTAPVPERAILMGVEWRENAWPCDRSLDELERLAATAGAEVSQGDCPEENEKDTGEQPENKDEEGRREQQDSI